jgi:Family of unknown function (DUF6256)
VSSHLFSQDVVPIGTGYLILMGVLAAGLRMQREPAADSETPEGAPSSARTADTAGSEPDESGGKIPGRVTRRFRPGWPRLLAHIVATALGGYVLLMSVDLLYYYGVARVAGSFLESAFTGSALLLVVALPLFAARSWLSVRRRRARDTAPGETSGTPS